MGDLQRARLLKLAFPHRDGRRTAGPARERGLIVARALAGAWRPPPTPPSISPAEFAAIVPLLLETGAGALAWWRIRHSAVQPSPVASLLKQAYRLQAVLAALHEQQLIQALTRLRSAGVEPLLAKGWAVARLYPEPGLRPYGDIDLYVSPDRHGPAAAALRDLVAQGCPVDLHAGIRPLSDRDTDEISRRAYPIPLGGTEVRVLGPEDQLRFLCQHMLEHGAWRPLWLCDVAAALESRPARFDWSYFLRGSRRRSDGITCALMLAHHLLGARLEDTPLTGKTDGVPRWLVAAALKRWGTGYHHREPLTHHLRLRSGVLESLRRSWPDPITATAEVRGPFNGLPRLPFQVAFCLKRSAEIAMQFFRPVP